MEDLVYRGIEQIAVMADDDHRARIVREMVFKPQRAFEIEIVGRLVQQQEIGSPKQRGGERDAHSPAAGKFRTGPRLVGAGKPQAAENRSGAGGRRMGVDVDEPRLDFRNPVRIMMVPVSVGSSPRIAWNNVDLPAPLRPTRPTRAPGTICAEP